MFISRVAGQHYKIECGGRTFHARRLDAETWAVLEDGVELKRCPAFVFCCDFVAEACPDFISENR